jgi:NAD(P)H dehydrogenase (quinone)
MRAIAPPLTSVSRNPRGEDWCGRLAILKGFLERVLQPDLVESSKKGKFTKILIGKSAHIIMTMDMPGFIYR